jgi:hypothetical protein
MANEPITNETEVDGEAGQPNLDVWIGARRVIASGVVVLGRADPSFLVMLGNLTIQIAFVPDPGGLNVDIQLLDDTTMRIRFTGTVDPFGASYEVPNIAHLNGQWVHLSAVIYTIAETAVVRQIAYTFTGSEDAL